MTGMRDDAASATVAPYRAPAWLRGGHAQTIWPSFMRLPAFPMRRERVEIGDGDFWDFDWLATPAAPDAPLVVLFHGLEGSATSPYARALFAHLAALRWRSVVPHFRGCGGEPNRLPRAYHSGDHAEVAAMMAAIRARIAAGTVVFAAGVSLGGSALLNWLGRQPHDAASIVQAAAAVSAPLDLSAAGYAIGRGANRLYTHVFLTTLKPKAIAMAARFPGLLDANRVRSVRTMWEFDDTVTAPLHGFAGADDYWTRASSKSWLAAIAQPTLVLNAKNDPFIPASSLAHPGEVSAAVTLEQPRDGGHVGFVVGRAPGRFDWLPRRLTQFFVDGV
ncbi:MAG TPA: alpha/beta fold hydrolase [Casimicrobiaceae bacterium]